MALTQIRGSQVKDHTLKNINIALDAAIELTKLEKMPLTQDGSVALLGDLNLNDHKITGLLAGTDAKDGVNLEQLQNAIAGLRWKEPVVAGTIGNITLSGTQIVDGVTLSVGDRVLVKNQTLVAENGIYVVSSEAWVRSVDADNSPGEELKGAAVLIESGTQAQTAWTCNNTPVNVGTDPVTFVQFNGASAITAGTGMTKNGNTLNVEVTSTGGLNVFADALAIKLATDSALNTTAAGLAVDASIAGAGLGFSSGVLEVVPSAAGGLEVVSDAVQVKLATNSGMSTTSAGLSNVAGAGIALDATGIKVNLAANSGLNTTAGLALDASSAGIALELVDGVYNVLVDTTGALKIDGVNKLAVRVDAAGGLEVNTNGLAITSSAAGDALSLTNGVLDVKTASTGSIQVVSDELAIKLAATSGLATSASGLAVVGSTAIELNASNQVAVKLAATSGLNTTAGLALDASSAGAALELVDGVYNVVVESAKALEIVDDKIGIKVANASGLAVSTAGITVDASIAGDALTLTSGVLDVKTASTGSIQVVSDELAIKLATNSALTTSAAGLTVDTSIAGAGLAMVNGVMSIDYVADEVAITSDHIVYTITGTPAPGTLSVFMNGMKQREGAAYDYTVAEGVISFNGANSSLDTVTCTYFRV